MLPTIKVYEVDYSFIIKNYLDVSLWNKKWTLFEYMDYKFYLEIEKIYTKSRKIVFTISIEDNNYIRSDEIYYDVQNTSIKILKQQINGAMFRCIQKIEENKIINSDIYQEACDLWDAEKEILREIAKDFLDENGVTNEDIRDAYIDKYVDDNDKSHFLKSAYLEEQEYRILTELYIVFLGSVDDEISKQRIITIKNKIGIVIVENVQSKIKEYVKRIETEEYVKEQINNLESI